MADQVAMKVLDTMHMSNVSADNLVEGDVILVSEADAKNLEDRGLAERGGTASKAVNTPNPDAPAPLSREALEEERGQAAKAISAAPANKMEAAPANKAVSAASAPAKASRKGK
jgi:hypothetical protein